MAIFVGLFPAALSIIRSGAGFLRCLPILALVPLVAKVFGIAEHAKILLISWACFFPVFLSTVGSIGHRVPDLELRIGVRRLSRMQVWLRYELPRLLAGFASGVEIAVGIGWLTVVAAETLGTMNTGLFRGGLGNAVYVAFNNDDFELGLWYLFLFGLLGITTSAIWRWISRKVVAWFGLDQAIVDAK